MNLTAEKRELIDEILRTEDKELILLLTQLLHSSREKENSSGLSEFLKSKVASAKKDYEEGKTLSHNEVKNLVQSWGNR